MNEKLKAVYQAVHRMHEEVYTKLKEIDDETRACSNMEELADTAFACRETRKLADDIRKMCDVTQGMAEKICCAVAVKDEFAGPVKTEYCTATLNIKMCATLPSKTKDPEAYKALLDHFGIDNSLVENDAVRFHWPGMVDYVTGLCEQGRPLPPGLNTEKTYPVYALKPLTKRKAIEVEKFDNF